MQSTWLRAASSAGRAIRSTQLSQLPRSHQLRRLQNFPVSRGLLPLFSRRAFYSTSANDVLEVEPNPNEPIKAYEPLDTFPRRHIGPSAASVEQMLKVLDPPVKTLDDFVKQVIPPNILSSKPLKIQSTVRSFPPHFSEHGVPESKLNFAVGRMMENNHKNINFMGCGYYGTHVPAVIQRNVLENPAWYTSYTPYQPEISQGRLESLLNFQTMVSDLTSLPIANASVLDEPTAAAEAMTLSLGALPLSRQKRTNKTYLVSNMCHPHTIAVLHSRAEGFGITIEVDDVLADGCKRVEELGDDLVGVLVQYPDTEGGVEDFRGLSEKVHKHGASLSVATDLLALTVLTPPGEFGADVAFGSSQRFGVPMGYGGPHAAFFACTEQYKRKIPGRLIGLSKDRLGDPAARLALQTREQHIRREKATSNICTAQALLANMSAFYAIYHGPNGLTNIARSVIAKARHIQDAIIQLGYRTGQRGRLDNAPVNFDTIVVNTSDKTVELLQRMETYSIQVRQFDQNHIGITVDETTTTREARLLLEAFGWKGSSKILDQLLVELKPPPVPFRRSSPFLTHPVFNSHHSETELLRYIHHLQSKDLSLVHSMIPLGSCTMKLNATTEMAPLSLAAVSEMHPFTPASKAKGYTMLIQQLEEDLASITGFHSVSVQPNSGAQGEFAGLRVIRKYQEQQSEKKRDICLIPVSAHGTNPASAAMAGMRVVPIKCDTATGNLDIEDLKAKCKRHSEELSAIMITYPSTFGIFEPKIKEVCELIHQHGGQVYMDGANMNAQIGLCSPGEIGADVCHLNLHKTFCIPHGGGGPGVGPIGVKEHLAPFLPGHLYANVGGQNAIPPISGAPWGSASLLPISWAYIKMMGSVGLTQATKVGLLNANYILSRLRPHYPILYTNENGRCAHEFILDVRRFKETAGIEAIDVAKRLQDYGFHAPTMSWPVANTLMIEPTESESKEELDRFCDALISIRKEIEAVEKGEQPKEGNVLKMAPHSQKDLIVGGWDRPYSREKAAYPLPYLKEKKFWPSVTRLDDAYGDTNLFCTCAPVESLEDLTGEAAPTST